MWVLCQLTPGDGMWFPKKDDRVPIRRKTYRKVTPLGFFRVVVWTRLLLCLYRNTVLKKKKKIFFLSLTLPNSVSLFDMTSLDTTNNEKEQASPIDDAAHTPVLANKEAACIVAGASLVQQTTDTKPLSSLSASSSTFNKDHDSNANTEKVNDMVATNKQEPEKQKHGTTEDDDTGSTQTEDAMNLVKALMRLSQTNGSMRHLAVLEGDRSRLETELAALQRQVTESTTENTRLRETLGGREAEFKVLKNDNDRLNATNQEFKNRFEKCGAENTVLRHELRDREIKLQELKTDYTRLDVLNRDLKIENDRHTEQELQVHDEKVETKAMLEDIENQQRELERKQRALERTQYKIGCASEKMEAQQQRLNDTMENALVCKSMSTQLSIPHVCSYSHPCEDRRYRGWCVCDFKPPSPVPVSLFKKPTTTRQLEGVLRDVIQFVTS